MGERETLELEYRYLSSEIRKFVCNAKDADEMNMRVSLAAHAVASMKEIKALELADKETAMHIIEKWENLRGKPETGAGSPDGEEVQEDEATDEGGLMPVEPQGSEPDAALLNDEPPKRKRGRPKKEQEA